MFSCPAQNATKTAWISENILWEPPTILLWDMISRDYPTLLTNNQDANDKGKPILQIGMVHKTPCRCCILNHTHDTTSHLVSKFPLKGCFTSLHWLTLNISLQLQAFAINDKEICSYFQSFNLLIALKGLIKIQIQQSTFEVVRQNL